MYSRYFVIIAGHPIRDEWMNIGILLYDGDGNLVSCKVDGTRAVAANSPGLRDESDRDWAKWSEGYAKMLPNIAAVERMRDSMGHASHLSRSEAAADRFWSQPNHS